MKIICFVILIVISSFLAISLRMKTRGNLITACNNLSIQSTRNNVYLNGNCKSGLNWVSTQINIADVFANYPRKTELGVDNSKVSEGCRLNGTILDCARSTCTKNTRYQVNLDELVANIEGNLTAQNNGYFSKSCKDISFSNNILSATCQKSADLIRVSSNLNNLIANIDGKLEWKENGSFGYSCVNDSCRLLVSSAEAILECVCRQIGDRSTLVTTIDLNKGISYSEGKFKLDISKKKK